jgi:hypothetical protein
MEKKMSKKLGLILTGSLILFNACLFAEKKDKLPEKKKQVITGKALGYNETVSLKGDKKGNKHVNCKHPKGNIAKGFGYKEIASLKGIKNAKNHDNCKHPKKNTAKVFGFK